MPKNKAPCSGVEYLLFTRKGGTPMNQRASLWRSLLISFLSIAFLVLLISGAALFRSERFEGKAKTRNGRVQAEVVNAAPGSAVFLPAAAPNGFAPQTRLGFTVGDQ